MRRWLHCAIVALLCLTLCMDSVRACWYLRCRSHACPPLVVHHAGPPVAWSGFVVCDGDPAAWVHGTPSWPSAWDAGVTEVVVSGDAACGCGSDTVVWEPAQAGHVASLPAACCVPCDGSADPSVHHVVENVMVDANASPSGVVSRQPDTNQVATDAAAERVATGDSVVVHDPTIVLGGGPAAGGRQPAAGAERQTPTARPAAPQPQEPLPDLRPATADAAKEKPVPASLDVPAEPAAKVADEGKKSPADTGAMPAAPAVEDLAARPDKPSPTAREVNLFDELTEESDAESDEPRMQEGEDDGDEPGAATQEELPPAKKAPADDDAAPAAEETATFVPDEPLRRWTDSTGDHHAQGWLVEIRADEARILKVTGRHTTMALADLSGDDQAYVAEVAARLAAGRPAAAAATATAGL